MIDLKKHYLVELKNIISQNIPNIKVIMFGSRVSGKSKQYSDIDLAIISDNKVDWRVIEKLKSAFSESNLPYMVDIVDWHAISEEFQKVILEKFEVIQEKND